MNELVAGAYALDDVGRQAEAAALAGAALDFRPLPHRLQWLGERDGIGYVNDSISTTPHASLAALDCHRGRRVAVLLGGHDRGLDWTDFAGRLRHDAPAAVLTMGGNGPRIHALLALHGVRQPITYHFGERLATLTDWAGQPLLPGVVARLSLAWRGLVQVETELREARHAQRAALRAAASPAARRAARLQQLRGIKAGSALMLAKEVFSRDLRNRRQVGALSGLVAVPYQSGEAAHDQGISRAGNRRVRAMAIEIAWSWLRYQPDSELSQWYQQRFGSSGKRMRRIGIVAMARRLMIDLWRFVEHGILPAGARVKRGVAL